MASTKPNSRNPWVWVPTLYIAQGLPYAVVNTMSVIMYKSLGVSNAEIALYTSWLNLPWVLKPLWSPVVDILKTRRLWIWATQLLLGAGFAAVGLGIPAPFFLKVTLMAFWLLAFNSATHDIAADGFYMLATTEKEQAFFVGIRSTFFRISMITGQGLLVMLAGLLQTATGLPGVGITVEASPGAALVNVVQPPGNRPAAGDGELRVVAERTQVAIAPEPRAKVEVNALLEAARAWNSTNGFHGLKQTASTASQQAAAQPSWWTRQIAAPFGQWLRRSFGPETKAKSNLAGNIGVASLHLSRQPGRQVVVTLALQSGDKSLSVAEGARLVFSDENWNKPALVVFQADPKLRTQSAAVFEVRSGKIALSWSVTMGVLVAMFLFFGVWHRFILPWPAKDKPGEASSIGKFWREFFATFGAFFRKPRIGFLICFLLLYRFGEAQLVRMVSPFLLDGREVGGLGLTTGQVGFVYGTIGIIALTCGGLLGGFAVSRHGLRAWLWPMVCIMHLPDAMFIYLAYAQPENFFIINLCVAVEQFGYGFGFTAYMLYMIHIARGEHSTAHYAICTGFMAMSMMIPGMWSGWLQEVIGYPHFFVWVILATIPSFLVVFFVPLEREFGKQTAEAA